MSRSKNLTHGGLLVLALVVGATAVPAGALAHGGQTLESTTTPGGIEFGVPVPAFSMPFPTFSVTIGDKTVSSGSLPGGGSVTVNGGTYVLGLSGSSSSPAAESHDHCSSGEHGVMISAVRVPPSGTASIFFDPGARGGDTVPVGEGTYPLGGGKPTSLNTDLCSGL